MPTGIKANVDGSAALQVGGTDYLTVTSGGNVTFPQAATFSQTANLPNTFGFKNRIINGAMVIDQRNAGASVTPINGQYTLDRYAALLTQASKFTIQRNAGSVTPPAGFSNYLGMTVGASANVTVSASDFFGLYQWIEGFNIADLAWGTASAAPVTVSFWARSSVTGTFGAALQGITSSYRSYPFTYTISAANTWEQKTITIPGDTSSPTGGWPSNNSGGLLITFSLGAGSTFLGTAGAWNSNNTIGATGQTNIITTNSATLYITGVQLEKGSTATSFDFRDYGTELALCQRYYWKTFNQSAVASNPGSDGAIAVSTTSASAGGAVASWRFAVPMRAAPTQTFVNFDGTVGVWRRGDVSSNASVAVYLNPSDAGGTLYNTGTVGVSSTIWGHVVAAIEL